MENGKFQEFLTMSWERVLSSEEDIIEFFKMLNIKDLKNAQILSRTVMAYGRLTMMIRASNVNGKLYRIIIDVTSGAPTWEQFINVTYDQGNDTDVKIILYGKVLTDLGLPAGGDSDIANLVRRNNRCGVKTLLIKGVNFDHNGQRIVADCAVKQGWGHVSIDEKQILPSKRQIQEAEFWAGYYLWQWATDDEFIGIDDDIIGNWSYKSSCSKGLMTKSSWNDEGFYISLTDDPGSEVIEWIWDNRRERFESAYPGCRSVLRVQDGKPYAISVKIENLSMTDLISSEPKDKWSYGTLVYRKERKFREVANEVIEDYHNEKNATQIAAVA